MIDGRAVISPQADIAADVAIGPFSVSGADVVVGAGTWIGPHVVINGPTHIEIGDRNVIRECATVHRGTRQGDGVTRIGDDNLLMAYSHVGHDCRLGNHIVLSNVATLGGHVEIGDFAIMGGLSAAHQFTKLGAHCFVANNAAVTRDVPPYVMAVGQPAEPHSINVVGLKRRGFTDEQIRNLKRAYRTLYRSGLKLKEALERLETAALTQEEIRPLVEFIKRSSRSIVR
jgi:UDP-N-acetylglucosamine acyltransferase